MASNHSNNDSSLRSYPSATLSDLDELRKVFARFDTNGDGKISASELAGVMSALGSDTPSDEISQMMSEMDSDNDGFVSLNEFADFCAKKVEGDENGAKELRDAFDMYDQDKNGVISAEELHMVLTRLGERCSVEDCGRMIQSVDSDGDGNVNFDEFRRMMTAGKKSQ